MSLIVFIIVWFACGLAGMLRFQARWTQDFDKPVPVGPLIATVFAGPMGLLGSLVMIPPPLPPDSDGKR